MRPSLRKPLLLAAATLLTACPLLAQKMAPVAQTPAMGWNSWNYFAERVDDKGVRAAADQIVATGMKDAGYVYVNIDDTWEGERDASGVLHTNAKFPDMKALADYVHSKGLKIGIYSGPGNKTCAGYPASLGHEQQDADTYASSGLPGSGHGSLAQLRAAAASAAALPPPRWTGPMLEARPQRPYNVQAIYTYASPTPVRSRIARAGGAAGAARRAASRTRRHPARRPRGDLGLEHLAAS